MEGDPCPMHKHFHTILALMGAHDPLLSCVHHANATFLELAGTGNPLPLVCLEAQVRRRYELREGGARVGHARACVRGGAQVGHPRQHHLRWPSRLPRRQVSVVEYRV